MRYGGVLISNPHRLWMPLFPPVEHWPVSRPQSQCFLFRRVLIVRCGRQFLSEHSREQWQCKLHGRGVRRLVFSTACDSQMASNALAAVKNSVAGPIVGPREMRDVNAACKTK